MKGKMCMGDDFMHIGEDLMCEMISCVCIDDFMCMSDDF